MPSTRWSLLAAAASLVVVVTPVLPLPAAVAAVAAVPPPDSLFTYGANLRSSADGSLTDVTSSAGRLTMTGSLAGKGVLTLTLAPPTDAPLAAGEVVATSTTAAGAGTALLNVGGALCPTPQPGRVAVDEVAYGASGELTAFTGRYAYACSVDGTPMVSGEIRLSSTRPIAQAKASLGQANPVRVGVGATHDVVDSVLNTGGADLTLGSLAVVADSSSGASVVDDACSGTTIRPGATCDFTLRLAPTVRSLTPVEVVVVAPTAELPGLDDQVRGGAVRVVTQLSSDGLPEAPVLKATVGVDGVLVSWPAVPVSATTAAVTSYDVHRTSTSAGDQDWTVAASRASGFGQVDSAVKPGASAVYTVRAVTAYGPGPWSEPLDVVAPPWDGPYDPARRELTMVWDEATGGSWFDGATTHLPSSTDPTPWLLPTISGGRVSFGDNTYTYLSLPAGAADGHYAVGTAPGELDVRADSGRECTSPAGTADVQHEAPSRTGGYASLSVDADLLCGDGHHLRAELRWNTPETVHVLSTPSSTVAQAVWGRHVSTVVTVTNSGSATQQLGAARLVDAGVGPLGALTLTGSTCAGAVLEPGQTCEVTIDYAPTAGTWDWANAILVVASPLGEVELGVVTGMPVASLSGPQEVRATTRPGHVDLSWSAPVGTDGDGVAGYRVEDVSAGAVTVLGSYDATTTTASLRSLTGQHQLRVVVRTSTGHEAVSDLVTVSVPVRWLLTMDGQGIRTWSPDGDTGGGRIGLDWVWGVSASPARDVLVVSAGYSAAGLTVRDAEGRTLRTLTSGPSDDVDPAVSPDGTRVVFTRYGAEGASKLMVVPLAGGAPVEIPGTATLSHPSWTPDGRAVVASDDRDVTPVPGLVRVAVDTGARSDLPGTSGAWSPSVSRTGTIAYVAHNATSGRDEVRVTGPSGGTATVVGAQEWVEDVAWDPTGRWLAATGTAPWDTTGRSWVYDRSTPAAVPRTLPGGDALAWLDQRDLAPSASVTVPALTGGTATLAVATSDPDDAVGGLRRECRLDTTATWTACDASWVVRGLTAGTHTAYVRATDAAGGRSAVVSRSWTVDTSAPTVAVYTPPSVSLTTSFTVRWKGTDRGGAGVASYDVRDRSAPTSYRFGSYRYPVSWRARTSTSLAAVGRPGYEYCFSVRARDRVGNTGPWSPERCERILLDDRYLQSTGWRRGRASSYANGTYSKATRAGAQLTYSPVQGRRIAVVAATCSTCGAVDVYHAGVKIGRVSLYSTRTRYRQVRWLPIEPRTRTGTVSVRPTSSRRVYLDGIAVLH